MANPKNFGTESVGTGMASNDGVVNMSAPTSNEPDFDTWLAQQLQFNEPHLDNDGFCERVMAELPQVPARRAQRRASRFQYAAVIVASAIVCWQFPFESVLAQLAQQSVSLYSLLGVGVLGSLAAMTGGIVAARR